MLKLKNAMGYIWATASILVFAVFVMLSQGPADEINKILNIKISPRIDGGEVARIVKHKTYETIIHREVFDGVLNERKNGFVQIEWKPVSGILPEEIDEDIDYDNNGEKDFTVHYKANINSLSIEKNNPQILEISKIGVFSYKDIKGFRIELSKQK